jgi:hypothetical protein
MEYLPGAEVLFLNVPGVFSTDKLVESGTDPSGKQQQEAKVPESAGAIFHRRGNTP